MSDYGVFMVAPRTIPTLAIKEDNPNVLLGRQIALENGIYGEEWECLYLLGMNESGWDHTIWNKGGSGAYGIPQSLPATKMKSYGYDYMTNPAVQIRWMIDYVNQKYKGSCNAYHFQVKNNWY